MRRLIIISYLLFLGSSTIGCSTADSNQMEVVREGGYRVSATANGKAQNISEELVHRIPVIDRELQTIVGSGKEKFLPPFSSTAERDSRGKVTGLRVTAVVGVSSGSQFGLRKGDLITAVGTQFTKTDRDLWELFEQLQQKKQASMTIIREGKHHKIFYFVEKSIS